MRRTTRLLAVLILSLPFAANADVIGLDIVEDGANGFDSRSFTLGWSFTISEAMYISALGTWDQDADGLNVGQNVSLWTAGGTLLASAFVDNSADGFASAGGSGQWLFADIANVFLAAGTYVIGADRQGGSGDVFQFIDTIIATDSRVTWNESLFSDSNTFGFPMNSAQGSQYFGPSFLIAVPEPGTLALLGFGLVALGLTGRRRRDGAA